MPDSDDSETQRRTSVRARAEIPVEYDTITDDLLVGVARDVSEGGMLLLSKAAIPTGDPILVRFRPDGVGERVEVSAKVLRSEPNDEESLWAYRSALSFSEPIEISLSVD